MNVMFPELADITGHPKSKGDIIIGNDVWIGEGAVIMGGVNIGSGAVIATNAVVTKNVEPYSIVAGIPARVVKMRFDDVSIGKLLKIAWWDWSDEEITIAGRYLMSTDVSGFIEKYL